MNRRHFLLGVLASPALAALPKNWKPAPAQEKFYGQELEFSYYDEVSEVPVSLFGVPYHHSNASTGRWIGISREG